LDENCKVSLANFEVKIKYKVDTAERVAVFNTRGEANVLGYMVSEPMISANAFICNKKEKLLLLLMANYGTNITSNSFLMSQ